MTTDEQLRKVLAGFPSLVLALVFGSYAKGSQRADSDLDIAVQGRQALTVTEKIALISALAEQTGRPIDLIDLKAVSEPLLRRCEFSESARYCTQTMNSA